jgi:hypothetical protein
MNRMRPCEASLEENDQSARKLNISRPLRVTAICWRYGSVILMFLIADCFGRKLSTISKPPKPVSLIHEPDVIDSILRHLGMWQLHPASHPRAPADGPVVMADFDDGWPGYEEPVFVYHLTLPLERSLQRPLQEQWVRIPYRVDTVSGRLEACSLSCRSSFAGVKWVLRLDGPRSLDLPQRYLLKC